MNNPHALYIHIPFCSHICNYCDFYKMRAKEIVKRNYVTTLIQELLQKKAYCNELHTIYIGGGTPTSIPFDELERLLTALHETIDCSSITEWTIEANPTDITVELVALLKKYGINRVSLGVQSFDPKRLELLGRTHTIKDVKQAVQLLQRGGIKNLNADLMFGLPEDNEKVIRKDLTEAINLGFMHISPYTLIMEERTKLSLLQGQGAFTPLDDEIEATLYRFIQHFLSHYGFRQYEVSNFALKGFESTHNLTYWNNQPYVGLGASASYYLDGVRYTNERHLARYTKAIESMQMTYFEQTALTENQMMEEEIMLGLRKVEGVSLDAFQQKYQISFFVRFPIASKLVKEKLLIIKKGFIRIPSKNLYISNAILLNFI